MKDTIEPAGARAAREATDLARYVADTARGDLVARVTAMIKQLGVDHVYCQLISVTGRVMGKSVPAAHWPSIAKKGVQLWYGAVADVCTDRRGNYIGYPVNAAELVALPDPETFCQLPWNKRVARVFCTVFRNREEDQDPGAFLTSDCRGNLRRLHQTFRRDHGLQLRVGCEPEMMWLKRGTDGKMAGGTTKPFAYHIDQFEQLSPVILRINDYARAMGIDMIQSDHEDAPGQLELNMTFDDALRNADRLTTYRQICSQVAREFNLIATFMAKPFEGVAANGCHHNLSLWRGGAAEVDRLGFDATLPGMDEVFTYDRSGSNEFLRPSGEWLPTQNGLHCIGGVIEHLSALTAIGASTVNSYRRLADLGYWAPVYADWGLQNRTVSLRVSAPGRLEYRVSDALVNPYLMASALLAAFDDGLNRGLDPGPPEQRNIYEAMEAGKQVRRLPSDLNLALDALDKDAVIRGALPGDMHRVFMHLKRDEWERFIATVTAWTSIAIWSICHEATKGGNGSMLKLTDDQIEQYRRDGYIILERIITEETAVQLRDRFEPMFERAEYETGVKPDEVNKPQGTPPYTLQICNGWRADLTIARVALDAAIGQACAELEGWPGARLQLDNLLWKPPGGRPIGFHQDSAYSYWLDKPNMVTCWIALEQTTAEGGPIMYAKGSHRWGEAQPILQFHGPDDDLAEARQWAERLGYELDLVPIVVPPGGGAFHNGWVWHGSRVNRTAAPRRSLAIHTISADARFNPDGLSKGTGPIYGRFMRFGTTELDDNHFPVMWHRDGGRTLGLEAYFRNGRRQPSEIAAG